MREVLIDLWLIAWCDQWGKLSPTDYMIYRVNQSVSLLSDDEVADWLLT